MSEFGNVDQVVSARAAAADPGGWRGLVRYLEESMNTQVGDCGVRAADRAVSSNSKPGSLV